MKKFRTTLSAAVLCLTLSLAAATAKAGIIIGTDGLHCDTETGQCCNPQTMECPPPTNGAMQTTQTDDTVTVEPTVFDVIVGVIITTITGV